MFANAQSRAPVLDPEPSPAAPAVDLADLERLRAALDAVGYGIVWLDEAGQLLHTNATATRMLAIGAYDARQRGITWDTFRPEHTDGEPARASDLFRAARTRERELTLVDATGSRQTVLLETHPPVRSRGTGRAEQLLVLRTLERPAARAAAPPEPAPRRVLPEFDLSAREREIVGLLLDGYRVASIAPRLYLSAHTIRNHLKSVFRKVGVTSQAELIELARG